MTLNAKELLTGVERQEDHVTPAELAAWIIEGRTRLPPGGRPRREGVRRVPHPHRRERPARDGHRRQRSAGPTRSCSTATAASTPRRHGWCSRVGASRGPTPSSGASTPGRTTCSSPSCPRAPRRSSRRSSSGRRRSRSSSAASRVRRPPRAPGPWPCRRRRRCRWSRLRRSRWRRRRPEEEARGLLVEARAPRRALVQSAPVTDPLSRTLALRLREERRRRRLSIRKLAAASGALADHRPPDRDGPRVAEPRHPPGPGLDPGSAARGALRERPAAFGARRPAPGARAAADPHAGRLAGAAGDRPAGPAAPRPAPHARRRAGTPARRR